MKVKVGYPISPNTEDPRSLANYYYNVKIQKTTFFENIISATQSAIFKLALSLGRRRDPEAWLMYTSQVNAYFNPPANEVSDLVLFGFDNGGELTMMV